jgi:osmoprotectant transport system permease protein
MRLLLTYLLLALLSFVSPVLAQSPEKLSIGSKAFAESRILGEALATLARDAGADVEHRSNLGGTVIVYQALRSGSIDVYPDYTGTVAEVMMKAEGRPSMEEMRAFLARERIGMSDPLGFNDGYALAVTKATQEKYGLQKISDLVKHPRLRLGFTHEFVGRKDGYKGLVAHYDLRMSNVRGMEHSLAYEAIAAGQIDVTEIYTTDAQIERLGLRLLEDDRRFFPRYDAVLLYRLELPARAPRAFEAMLRLVGKIDEPKMIRANGLVVLQKQTEQQAASTLLQEALGAGSASAPAQGPSVAGEILQNTLRHLQLVAIPLFAAIPLGVLLGVLATRSRFLATLALSSAGLLQTIPSLALLAFLIPFLGIGPGTALVALFLYSLLPIVRNTHTGLSTIPPNLTEAAQAMGLSPRAQLFRIGLPMASPAILAGVKTSAVINVGTATLAAFIGAGGLGDPIKRGLDLLDNNLILQGAVPAALLALLVQWGFDLLDAVFIPRGLRLSERPS